MVDRDAIVIFCWDLLVSSSSLVRDFTNKL